MEFKFKFIVPFLHECHEKGCAVIVLVFDRKELNDDTKALVISNVDAQQEKELAKFGYAKFWGTAN